MKTVGQLLKQERKKQKKTILQIHKITKLPLKTIEALENDDYTSLPSAAFVKGFIRSFANSLDLDTEKVLAIFRRDWQSDEKGEIIPRGLAKPLDQSGFRWTPKLTLILSIGLLILVFLGYISLQLKNFYSPPKLILESPIDNQEYSKNEIEIVGSVDKDASVYINDNLIDINENGNFNYTLRLVEEETLIEVKAIDRRGKQSLITRKVKLNS